MHTDVVVGAVDDMLCMACVTETINSRTEMVDTPHTHSPVSADGAGSL